MSRRFSHLHWKDRLKIEKMLKEGCKVQQIADALHVHYSTIYREIKRGMATQRTTDLIDREVYCADVAEAKYQDSLRAKGPDLKIGNDLELAQFLEEKMLEEKYSPAAALAAIKDEGRVFSSSISEWTLYQYISKGVFFRLTSRDLPMGGKKKQKYRKVHEARLPKGESIETRPEEINSREEPGHWEMDTVESGRGSTKRLLVMTERATRMELIFLMPNGKAESVVRALDNLERRLGAPTFAATFKSITVDNGSEFSDKDGIERSRLNKQPRTHIYVCHPYTACERGSNENCNKLIRRWFPKGMCFKSLTVKSVRAVEQWINNYPREILGFSSAKTMFTAYADAVGLPRLLTAI